MAARAVLAWSWSHYRARRWSQMPKLQDEPTARDPAKAEASAAEMPKLPSGLQSADAK
jgi:hypothetical protein